MKQSERGKRDRKDGEEESQPQGGRKERVKGRRRENCLIALTRKLTRLLRESQGFEIDLNVACSTLSIPKRRLYDIANVLEGIGCVTRSQKNHIRWDASVDLHQLIARIDPLPVLRRPRDDSSEASRAREQLRVRESSSFVKQEEEEFDCLHLPGLRSVSDENSLGISRSL